MKLFIAMPFGTKSGHLDPQDPSTACTINFDLVWRDMIRPLIPGVWHAVRADELRQSGVIDKFYMDWLLEADIVLVDLTFENPNVYYELGLRQALSKRSTVLLAQEGTVLPFDVQSQAVVHYDYFAEGERRAPPGLSGALMSASTEPGGSPVYTFLPDLHVTYSETGKAPQEEIAELRAEIERLEIQATQALGSAEQFERQRALRSELTTLLSKIVQTQLENARLLKEHSADAAYVQQVSGTLNQQAAFLLNEAAMVIEKIPKMVGDVEYNTLAYAFANSGEIVVAEDYYRRAIEVARTPAKRVFAQRSFAQFLFHSGRFDEARALYQRALEGLEEQDPLFHQTNGYTLQGWAWHEANVAKDPARAQTLFAQAQAAYEGLRNPVFRQQQLRALEMARRGTAPMPDLPEFAQGLRDLLSRTRS